MSLVAYDYSDESGIETDEEDVKPSGAELAIAAAENSAKEAAKAENSDDDQDQLPPVKSEPEFVHNKEESDWSTERNFGGALPSRQATNINFDLNILDRNRSQPIRITIPSLKDLNDDEPTSKKLKPTPSSKGSSLFSLLPAPKNATKPSSSSLIPQSAVKRAVPKPKTVTPLKKKQPPVVEVEPKDDEDSAPLTSFFFSAVDEPLPPPVDDSVIFPDKKESAVSSSEPALLADISGSSYDATEPGPSPSYSQASSVEEELPLDNDALRKLCGTRDRKRGAQALDIVDVSGSALVGDTSMILAKELTKEQPAHSFRRKSECSSLQRRKHQITYLAEQAKAQELELRNNWAQNRVTRKQTQAKYGF